MSKYQFQCLNFDGYIKAMQENILKKKKRIFLLVKNIH